MTCKFFFYKKKKIHYEHSFIASTYIIKLCVQAVFYFINDPQLGVVRELNPWTAMCVQNVDVHVSCSSQVITQLAAFFIDPRAE